MISFFVFGIEILLKITEKLYEIRPVTCYAECIFWKLVFCYRVLCIQEMKSTLSRLYIINQIFSVNNVLYFCFKRLNTPITKSYNKCMKIAESYKYTILYLLAN